MRGHEFLDKELQQIVRESKTGRKHVDKLVKVWLKDGDEAWLLIHVEIQSQKEIEFPRRLHIYHNRLTDRYNRMVVSLVVLADDVPGWKPNEHVETLFGCTTSLVFPVIKLLDYADSEAALEKSDNPFGILVWSHLKTLQTRKSPESRRAWKIRIVRCLYEKGWPREQIVEMFRFIDWLMVLPKELDNDFWNDIQAFEREKKMPYVTSVERIGMEKGMEKGQKLGEVIGLQRALIATLETKFGAAGKKLLPRIRRIEDADGLLNLHQLLVTATSLEEFRKALP